MNTGLNIAIVGMGNVGQHLFHALARQNLQPTHLCSSNDELLTNLSKTYQFESVNMADLNSCKLDMIFTCVADDAIVPTHESLQAHSAALVHCSGSTPVVVRPSGSSGVFYPFQTFTKSRSIDWSVIPVFVTANNEQLEQTLCALALQIGGSAQVISDEQRRWLHLAGVYGANFVNHMLSEMTEALENAQLPLSVAEPLIRETVSKAFEMGAKSSQTGPALRGDAAIVQKHLDMLKDDRIKQQLYRVISQSINSDLP